MYSRGVRFICSDFQAHTWIWSQLKAQPLTILFLLKSGHRLLPRYHCFPCNLNIDKPVVVGVLWDGKCYSFLICSLAVVVCLFVRWFLPSFERLLAYVLACSCALSLLSSFVCFLVHSFACLLVYSFARFLFYSFAYLLVYPLVLCSFTRLFVCSFTRLLVCSFTRLLFYLFGRLLVRVVCSSASLIISFHFSSIDTWLCPGSCGKFLCLLTL